MTEPQWERWLVRPLGPWDSHTMSRPGRPPGRRTLSSGGQGGGAAGGERPVSATVSGEVRKSAVASGSVALASSLVVIAAAAEVLSIQSQWVLPTQMY